MKNAFWVFGYGSLMWRPGFDYIDAQPATLAGFERSFCIYSHYYRGTPSSPGLVLGLDPKSDASCRGVAFQVADENRDTVIAYLTERELCGYAYKAETHPLTLDCETQVDAYTFVADPDHALYAGDLGLDKAASLIMEAEGNAGLNRDYLINSVRELEAHGYEDQPLHDLLKKVEYLTGIIEAGAGI
ncbi:gamma-glutamylcyclotransferase [Terasakiella sp. A23]|uniref:gamma-glutamylcyclotransferase n=1 Tax=Terasakiella sp. FCG-A23 TaxID=3080561 RepID=UPI002952FD2A|nr:gamma-glutamylcyclotransferase [Terasakiella sp. A23]MDV7341610.1 gamma-glutamylcyclotransferase [Terasakiella sp. A23]